jgi:folylpolyglutamate synthase/dihydropteroate synthase
MFQNNICYGNNQICTFTSPHVPRVGEYIRVSGTTYQITSVTYILDITVKGTTAVIIIVKPI